MMEFDRLIARTARELMWKKGDMGYARSSKRTSQSRWFCMRQITTGQNRRNGPERTGRLLRFLKIDGNWAITMDLIEGKMLADLMKKKIRQDE